MSETSRELLTPIYDPTLYHSGISDYREYYGGIREMQEAKGMIRKGEPLWDYGITNESGVMPRFPICFGSGTLPSATLPVLPIPMAADGSPGIALKEEDVIATCQVPCNVDGKWETKTLEMRFDGHDWHKDYKRIWERDSSYDYFPRNMIKLVPWQQLDFIGRAADL